MKKLDGAVVQCVEELLKKVRVLKLVEVMAPETARETARELPWSLRRMFDPERPAYVKPAEKMKILLLRFSLDLFRGGEHLRELFGSGKQNACCGPGEAWGRPSVPPKSNRVGN